MRKKVLFLSISGLLILFLAGCGNSNKKAGKDAPITPPVVDEGGWTEYMRAEGDLNSDGVPDRAVVYKKENEITKQIFKNTRKLVIQIQEAGGAYATAVESMGALMCGGCGGSIGDPLQSIAIEDNTLTIIQEGGSDTYRWFNSYSFTLNESVWLLSAEEAYSYTPGDEANTKAPFDWDLGAQQPGETTLDEFDIMLGII